MKGKIVLCIGHRGGSEAAWSAFLAGAVGTVIVDGLRLPKDSSNIYPLPASRLSAGDGKRIAYYISSTRYRLTQLPTFIWR